MAHLLVAWNDGTNQRVELRGRFEVKRTLNPLYGSILGAAFFEGPRSRLFDLYLPSDTRSQFDNRGRPDGRWNEGSTEAQHLVAILGLGES